MILHTLGPKETDSFKAAKYVKSRLFPNKFIDIKLHDSFDDIYENLENEKKDLMLVPVAYRSSTSNSNWIDNNYKYWDKINIIKTFSLPTMPMAFIKRDIKNNKIILHPATIAYLREFEEKHNLKLDSYFEKSKPFVLDKFAKENFEYAIISENILKKRFENKLIDFDYKILYRYEPKMIWCIYQIK